MNIGLIPYINACIFLLCKDIFQASMRFRKIRVNKMFYFLENTDLSFLNRYDNYFINSLNEKSEMVNKYSFDNEINICPEWLITLSNDLANEKILNLRYFETMFNKYLSLCGYSFN